MNHLVLLMPDELTLIRKLLHKEIMSTKAGKYTEYNELAKKIDKILDVSE